MRCSLLPIHLFSGKERGATEGSGEIYLRWVRSSNVFIYQKGGPSKLSTSIPDNMNFANIPELETLPDSLTLCRLARANGAFFEPEPDDVDIFGGVREFNYQLDPDRDMNGAGSAFASFSSADLAMLLRSVEFGGTISSSSTGTPALAICAAIPLPMTPAPMTQALETIIVIEGPSSGLRPPSPILLRLWLRKTGEGDNH